MVEKKRASVVSEILEVRLYWKHKMSVFKKQQFEHTNYIRDALTVQKGFVRAIEMGAFSFFSFFQP